MHAPNFPWQLGQRLPFTRRPTRVSAAGVIYFSNGFEEGGFSAWSAYSIGDGSYQPHVNGVNPHTGSYSYEQEYFCQNGLDHNRYVIELCADFGQPAGLTDFFLRTYLYAKTPEADTTPNKIWQRKLTRTWFAAGSRDIVLNSWSGSGGSPLNALRLSFVYYGLADTQQTVYDIATLQYDTWYCLEQEFHLNTPGVADGTYRLYIDGVEAYAKTATSLRGTNSTGVDKFWIGAQAQSAPASTLHEFRYWDDVIISDSYIGP